MGTMIWMFEQYGRYSAVGSFDSDVRILIAPLRQPMNPEPRLCDFEFFDSECCQLPSFPIPASYLQYKVTS